MSLPKLTCATIVAVMAVTACGSSEDDAKSSGKASPGSSAGPSGMPIKLMTLNALSGPSGRFPEIPEAAKAAAAAINKAGGVAGHPIEITACDDKFDPNQSAACARRAVDEGFAAVVGSITPHSGSYIPVLAKGGVPTVANQPAGSADTTNEFSFPIAATALQLVGGAAVVKAEGGNSIQFAGPNVAAVVGLGKLLQGLLPTVGVDYKGMTLFPPPTSNFDQFAASVYGSGADGAFPILATARQTEAFIGSALAAGEDLTKTTTVLSAVAFNPDILEGQLKDKLNGAYIVSGGPTVTDESIPGIKTFHEELAAAGTPDTVLTDSALQAWVGVHVIAQVLEKATGDITKPATLIAAMKAAGPIDYPGWTPFDWSKPALPNPLAKALPRYFNTTVWVSKVVNNKLVSAVDGPVPFSGPIKLKS